MKKLISILLVGLLVFPILVKGAEKEYKTLNLKEVLEEEKIDSKLGSYKEDSSKVNVYLFRGNGCGFCRNFINFLNNNIDELGKYFNLVSYEVWYDKDNSALLKEVANFTGEAAGGVPYIIVGDKVFAGFTEDTYGEDFKKALKAEYEKKDRYDVFKEMEKAKNADKEASKAETNKIILWNAVFSAVTIGAVALMLNNTNKKIEALKNSKQVVVKETKEETKPTKKSKKK